MKEKIEPCPECGWTPKFKVYPDGGMRYSCINRKCSQPVKVGSFRNQKVALTVWNHWVTAYRNES